VELGKLHGYDIRHFTTGQQLLSYVSASKADVMICDIRLPDMTGLELMRIIRDELSPAQQPQFIFITGHGDVVTAVAALRLGAVDFLNKPIAGDELIKTIGRAILRAGNQLVPTMAKPVETNPTADDVQYYSLAKQILSLEMNLAKLSNRNLFGDHAWSLLLALFLADFRKEVISASNLSIDAGVPLSTSTRRLMDLELDGFLTRQKDSLDNRRTIVALSDKGRVAVREHLNAIRSLKSSVK
jgi:DNA-binding response OmpR family regulator